jgi:outer membrane protein OmpA-like peptidoglycan-associated protein
MRLLLVPLAAAIVLAAAGCGGHAQSEGGASPLASSEASAAPSPSPEASASQEAASAAPEGSASPGGTPTPQPTPTPDLNLLSWTNGAIVRSYPQPLASVGQDVNRIAEHGVDYPTGAAGPFVYVYELPGPAAITGFTADLPAAEPSAAPASLTFAVSNAGPTSGFTNVGTITATASPGPLSLPASVTGRWIQITSNGRGFNKIGALGTVAPLPADVSLSGAIYVEIDGMPAKNGAFNPVPTDTSPWYRRFTTFGAGATAVRCFDGHLGDAYPGDLDGRVWTFHNQKQLGRAFVNDDASMIVGEFDGSPIYLARTDKTPKFCTPFTGKTGSGPHNVLVLDSGNQAGFWPLTQNGLPGYTYERMDAGMLDAPALAGKELVIINGVCDSSNYFGKGQGDGLLQWVSDGHKLLIIDADECSKSVYDFIPYQFTTSNPGARGASGKRLIIVENDSLGTNDKTDTAHYLDTQAWVNDTNNQLGDANTVTSTDPHWCGHLFGTNADNVNGFMEMYAQHGKGTIIYAGFDTDDSTKPGYDRLRTLEFLLPIPNDLACTQKVAGGFVIQPNQEGTFTAGTAATQNFSMELLANQGWKGHVAIATAGDFPATVTPNDFDVSGGTQPLKVAVSIPASAKAGAYTVTVTGDNGAGTTAQASITFTGTAPLKKAVIQKHQRIRIYGIHFDYDSAHIQPRSEPVIADIATLMKANPTWHFEVSGHTDSDGGAAYNLNLSQRRAQSVVNDLVTRYHIARSRLVAKGYGLTRPVASNATDAGKALNRRVELERLQ